MRIFYIKTNKKKKFGFTLIEVLVAASILAIISTMAVVNYTQYGNARKLPMAAQLLASDIRLMQSHTLALKEFDDGTPETPRGGWGIYVRKNNPNIYILFADASADHVYDGNEFFREIKLPAGIEIYDLIFNGVGPGKNQLHATYVPPTPTGWLCDASFCNGNQTDGQFVEIILTNDSGVTTKSVKINLYGLVDID